MQYFIKFLISLYQTQVTYLIMIYGYKSFYGADWELVFGIVLFPYWLNRRFMRPTGVIYVREASKLKQ